MMTPCTTRVTVTFVMEVQAGPWSDDCLIGQMRQQSLDAAKTAAIRLVEIAKASRIALHITDIGAPVVVLGQERA